MTSQVVPLNEQSFPISADRSVLHKLVRSWRSVVGMTAEVVQALPVWSRCIPPLALAMLFLAAGPALPWFVGKYAWTGKDFQEILGPSLLSAAVVIAAFQCSVRTSTCRIWMLCIPAIFLCRELHFSGTGTGVYLGIIAIVWYGIANSQRLQPVWNCRSLIGCWFAAACFYAQAVSVDSGVWKFLPHSQWWGVNLEETLESMGHLMILASSICGVVIVDRRPTNQTPQN